MEITSVMSMTIKGQHEAYLVDEQFVTCAHFRCRLIEFRGRKMESSSTGTRMECFSLRSRGDKQLMQHACNLSATLKHDEFKSVPISITSGHECPYPLDVLQRSYRKSHCSVFFGTLCHMTQVSFNVPVVTLFSLFFLLRDTLKEYPIQ